MTDSQQKQPRKRWKPTRRRRCELETCLHKGPDGKPALYMPVKPNQRFCSAECKHDYHFKNPTFRKFEDQFKKLVGQMIRQMVKPGALNQ